MSNIKNKDMTTVFQTINKIIKENELEEQNNSYIAQWIYRKPVEDLMMYSLGTLKNYVSKARKIGEELVEESIPVTLNLNKCSEDVVDYIKEIHGVSHGDTITKGSELYNIIYAYKGVDFNHVASDPNNIIYLLCDNTDLNINDLPRGAKETRFISQSEDQHIYDLILTTISSLYGVKEKTEVNLVCMYHSPSTSDIHLKEDTAFIMENFLNNNSHVTFNLISNNPDARLIQSFEGFKFNSIQEIFSDHYDELLFDLSESFEDDFFGDDY